MVYPAGRGPVAAAPRMARVPVSWCHPPRAPTPEPEALARQRLDQALRRPRKALGIEPDEPQLREAGSQGLQLLEGEADTDRCSPGRWSNDELMGRAATREIDDLPYAAHFSRQSVQLHVVSPSHQRAWHPHAWLH